MCRYVYMYIFVHTALLTAYATHRGEGGEGRDGGREGGVGGTEREVVVGITQKCLTSSR
jgi:hypothetical protein